MISIRLVEHRSTQSNYTKVFAMLAADNDLFSNIGSMHLDILCEMTFPPAFNQYMVFNTSENLNETLLI